MSESPTTCSMLWNHIFVSPQGKMKPCCRFKSKDDMTQSGAGASFKSERWEAIRAKMLAGEKVPGCIRCYEEEGAGKLSLRQRYNRHPELGLKSLNFSKPSLTWLEIPFSNRCNLACRMCDSRYSTKWLSDEKKFYGKTLGESKVIENDWSDLESHMGSLRHIKITGGEPLMDPSHESFLQRLVKNGNPSQIYLNYSTNLTIFPSAEVISLWKKFEKIELALSLDSYLENELNYIRFPTNGQQALENVIHFMTLLNEMDNLHLIMRATVSIFNIFSMPETLRFWHDQKQHLVNKENRNRIYENPTHLTHPEYLSPKVAPKQIKASIEKHYLNEMKYINDNTIKEQLTYLLKIMNQNCDDALFQEFIDKTEALDKIRGQSYKAIFPFLCS